MKNTWNGSWQLKYGQNMFINKKVDDYLQKPYCIKPKKGNCIKYSSLNMDALMYLQKI